MRDPASPFLTSGYHDVPWEEPELLRACLRKRWTTDFPDSAKTPSRPFYFDADFRFYDSSSKQSSPATLACRAGIPAAPPRSGGSAPQKQKKPLRVMKFGGTSVGDASCIARVIEIIRVASQRVESWSSSPP